MIVRTLPIRASALSGESFSSFVDRLAAMLDVPLVTMLARLGLIPTESCAHVHPGYGIILKYRQLRSFAGAVGVSVEAAGDLFLNSYDGVCCDLSGLDPVSPRTFQSSAYPQWIYLVGSHVCPACVIESGGAWQLRWKLPWAFACVEHRCMLVDTCPACYKRIASGFGQSLPVASSRVPDPLRCRNPTLEGGPKNRWTAPCGYPLASMDAEPLEAWHHLIEAQACLDAFLEGCFATVAGEEVSSLEYFSDLRSICVLLLTWGGMEEVVETSSVIRQTFHNYVAKRDEMRAARGKRAHGEDSGERYLRHHVAPQSAALLAAVIPKAISMLGATSPDEFSASLEAFAGRMRDPTGQYPALVRSFSGRLREAFDGCWRSRRKHLTNRLGIKDGERKREDPGLAGLTPNLVPQLLWEDEYQRRFAELMPGVGPLAGRRFCSAALVKLSGSYTWEEAAEELALSPRYLVSTAKRAVPVLGKDYLREERFGTGLLEMGRKLAKDPHAIDYGRRRRLLAGFTEIDGEYWKSNCAPLIRGKVKDAQRRRWAAVWLWCHLTEGDYHYSPWFEQHGNSEALKSYRMFATRGLNNLKEVLVRYAQLRWRDTLEIRPISSWRNATVARTNQSKTLSG